MFPCFRLKTACKVNPFDENPSVPKSKTFQTFPSRRATAPGHGFPLIKRKVREAALELDSRTSSECFTVTERDDKSVHCEQKKCEKKIKLLN